LQTELITTSSKEGVQDTSKIAYCELSEDMITERYREYMLALWGLGRPSTDLEVTYKAGYVDPNRFRPRRFELENKYGLLIECRKRVCSVSGKLCKCFWFSSSGLRLIN